MNTLGRFALAFALLGAHPMTVAGRPPPEHPPVPVVDGPTRQALFEDLRKYVGEGFSLIPEISEKKLKNARRVCAVPEEEEALALLDVTVLGSAKNCLLVTNTGVYLKNSFSRPDFIPFKRFVSGNARKTGWHEFTVDGAPFLTGGADMPDEKIACLLQDIGVAVDDDRALRLLHRGYRAVANKDATRREPERQLAANEQTALVEALQKFAPEGLLVAPSIPSEKEKNARKIFPVDSQEKILAMLDTTAFGSAKTGMLFTTRGVLVRNIASTTEFLPYREFAAARVKKSGWLEIRIGEMLLLTGGSLLSEEQLAACLDSAKQALLLSTEDPGTIVAIAKGSLCEWGRMMGIAMLPPNALHERLLKEGYFSESAASLREAALAKIVRQEALADVAIAAAPQISIGRAVVWLGQPDKTLFGDIWIYLYSLPRAINTFDEKESGGYLLIKNPDGTIAESRPGRLVVEEGTAINSQALARITDPDQMLRVATETLFAITRLNALQRITDPQLLAVVPPQGPHWRFESMNRTESLSPRACLAMLEPAAYAAWLAGETEKCAAFEEEIRSIVPDWQPDPEWRRNVLRNRSRVALLAGDTALSQKWDADLRAIEPDWRPDPTWCVAVLARREQAARLSGDEPRRATLEARIRILDPHWQPDAEQHLRTSPNTQ